MITLSALANYHCYHHRCRSIFPDVIQLPQIPVICKTPIITIQAEVYEFVYIVRSPGFEFPLISYCKTSPGLRADLAFYINAWKASVLTKLDDDRTIQ
jgi:hypothetical protein